MRMQPGVPRHFPKSSVQASPDTEEALYDDRDEAFPATQVPKSARRYAEVGIPRRPDGHPYSEGQYPTYTEVPPRATRIRVTAHGPVLPHLPIRQEEPLQAQSQSMALPAPQQQGLHWLVYVGFAMLLMLVGWIVMNALLSWWQTQQDSWHYGYPRTSQTEAVVGHGDSVAHPSHFVALNLHGQIAVIEIQGGDPARTKIYTGPTITSANADLAPVTLTFQDVNGDGKPDMILHLEGGTSVWINDNGQFRQQRPDEQVNQEGGGR